MEDERLFINWCVQTLLLCNGGCQNQSALIPAWTLPPRPEVCSQRLLLSRPYTLRAEDGLRRREGGRAVFFSDDAYQRQRTERRGGERVQKCEVGAGSTP